MNITTISASVRYSAALGNGKHKTVELGAEAELAPHEAWHDAQATLYAELGQQLKALWGNTASTHTDREHYCQEHGTPFKRYEKDGRVWWSHKHGQKWCKEK